MDKGDPSQVLDVMRAVLVRYMDNRKVEPEYRIQSAIYIGARSGRLMSEDHCIAGKDVPGGLRLTMRSGNEFDLTLKTSVPRSEYPQGELPLDALESVLGWMWDEEMNDYFDQGKPADHIFVSMVAVDNWLHDRNRTPEDCDK